MSTDPQTQEKEASAPHIPESTRKFQKLEEFKEWMQSDFRTHCEAQYGADVFADYIFPYYDDFMECLEYNLEDLGEQSIQDEELMFDVESDEIDKLLEDTND